MTTLNNGSLLTGYCPTCGEDVDVQQNGKCLKGHTAWVTTTQKGLDKQIFKPSALDAKTWDELDTRTPAVAAVAEPKEVIETKDPVVLPPSRIARQWMQQTQILIDSLRATKSKLEAGIKMERKNVARIDKAIMTLSAHLENYTLADTAPTVKLFTWSMKYERCVVCGTNEQKHKSRGMCVRCEGASRRVNKSK